jgi:hypothetical protein
MEGMMNKWQIGPVRLANGFDAVIHRFCEKRKRYIGEHAGRLGGFYAAEWNIAGEHTISGIGDPLLNLAPPPKKTVRVQVWLMVWPNHAITVFYKKADAVINAKKNGFALIEIDREVTEGEGL